MRIPTWGSNGYGITMVITPRSWDMLGYKTYNYDEISQLTTSYNYATSPFVPAIS